MDDNDLIFLNKSLNNDNNESINNLTSDIIKTTKQNILSELPITKKYNSELTKKLKNYRYVEELQELHIGCYIRWINIKNPENNIKLTNGAILCDVKISDNILLVCKNNINRIFNINMSENLLFQKLTDQEKIILYAMDCLN
jgi:transposase